MIINVMNLYGEKCENIIYKAFANISNLTDTVINIEKRNIIRDGIGEKLDETLKKFPQVTFDDKYYCSYVEAMLRSALLYYDQTIYLKTKDMNKNFLIDWGAEYLYIYLLSNLQKENKQNYDDSSIWLNDVFIPIIKSTYTIIPHIAGKANCASQEIISAYEYVKEKNNYIECIIDINASENEATYRLSKRIEQCLKGELECIEEL